MSDTPTSYPLSWPFGWLRTRAADRQAARFSTGATRYTGSVGAYRHKRVLTLNEAISRLMLEVRRLGAEDSATLSTNVRTRLDGLPRSGEPEPADPGAALYFTFWGKPVALACDKWTRTADNIVAIAKHIEALRGQERWGVGSLAQAFAGYARLPEPGGHMRRPWFKVLGLDAPCTRDAGETIYKRLAREAHPDLPGGNAGRMAELNAAIAEAREEWRRES